MNNKIKTGAVIIAAVGMLFFTSCKKDEVTPKPVISGLELGMDNSRIGHVGGDLHIEATIVAEGKIDVITVEIHQEEGSGEEIVVRYTEFAGLKNATLHKHVDIPAGTPVGDYHFHLIVTDQEGNQTTVEAEITIVSN